VGDWMKVNGESIHGTASNPFPKLAYRCTRKPGKLYIHVFNWPASHTINLPGLKNPVRRAYLLADAKKSELAVNQKDSGVTIAIPAVAPDANDSVIVVEISGDPTIEAVPIRQSSTGELKLQASEATVHGSTARYENPPDCIGFWTNAGDWVSWDAEISQPGDYFLELTYACENGSGGTKFSVSANDASVDYTVAETGTWYSFKTIKIGGFGFPSARRVTFAVKALNKPGYAVMNLKEVRLVKG
jgi:alpha-L-fucosidase